jgi:hypothetical protein
VVACTQGVIRVICPYCCNVSIVILHVIKSIVFKVLASLAKVSVLTPQSTSERCEVDNGYEDRERFVVRDLSLGTNSTDRAIAAYLRS